MLFHRSLQLAIIACICWLPATSFSGQPRASAYQRLRAQFRKANQVSLAEYQLGRSWYCSSGLRAAKGQLRYVPFWDLRYQWESTLDSNSIFNKHETYAMVVNILSGTGAYTDVFDGEVTESFRRHKDGHLVVEQARRSWSINSRQSQALKPSLVHEGLVAFNYALCQNPEWQGNNDWDYEQDQIFRDDEN